MKKSQKTKPSKKEALIPTLLLLAFVLTAVAGRFLVYEDQEAGGLSDKEVQALVDEQNAAQISSADGLIRDLEEIDKELTDINSSNNNNSKAEQIINDNTLTAEEKSQAVGALFSSCKQRKDTECMNTLISFMEENTQDSMNIWLYVDVARISKEQDDIDISRVNYQKAKAFADARGGEQHIAEVNSGSDTELTYQELVDGSN
jgi:ferritin